MIVSDLKQHQQSKSVKPAKRKHNGVRTPHARNAIVKDRMTGGYVANIDEGELADVLAGINLRLNAIELNQSRLMREGAVDMGYAAPLPSNVVPMHVAKQEQSKAAPVSHPLPVSGNEAQVLPAPEATVVEEVRPLKTADVVPVHIGKATLVPNENVAANDEVLIPEEVIEVLKQITDEDAEDLEILAQGYGMDIVECSDILYKEYAKREKHCYDTHGIERDMVQLKRATAQLGIVECSGALNRVRPVYIKAVDTKFAAWMRKVDRHFSERVIPEPHGVRAPLTKGEAAYRKKVYVKAVASRRPTNDEAFSTLGKMHRKLYVPSTAVTTMAQVAVIQTALWSGYQKTRKLLGMQPTVRGAKRRAHFEAEHKATLPVVYGPEIPQSEVVRRYHLGTLIA